MHAILRINGVPICGIHGKEGASMSITSWDCWLSYYKYLKETVAEGREVTPLREFAVWSLNGRVIPTPTAVWLTLEV